MPRVAVAQSLAEAVKGLAPGTVTFVLDEAERVTPLRVAFAPLSPTTAVAIVIGPEGGLGRAEVEELTRLHAVPVTLGALVLRTETAALAALAVLRHLDGMLG